jgi:hypothetical protein
VHRADRDHSAVRVRAGPLPPQEDLKRLSIEELLRIDVTSTARRPEPIGTTRQRSRSSPATISAAPA